MHFIIMFEETVCNGSIERENNFDKSNHHRTNLFIEAEPRISGTRSCCINCCLLVAPPPPRP